ncbi:TPA: hypothetical protein RQ360_002129 [Klebsiella michiganensis]|nr:hypothetical protein [Klebsiella michiganensis]
MLSAIRSGLLSESYARALNQIADLAQQRQIMA